jgi:hypothetical protein
MIAKLVALCAVVALGLACVAADPLNWPGADSDDEVAITLDLSAALPATRAEPPVKPAGPSGGVIADEESPQGRHPELDIFRPPRHRA